ncbi:MAG: restriction endonuclease [Gemmatimonadota bacterium]|nr:restriction endonuclease [Gemmatimonadota bacterium]
MIITTGTFTSAARKEATRVGAPPIDLIDCDELCDLIVKYEVGVEAKKRIVMDVEVNESYFAEI